MAITRQEFLNAPAIQVLINRYASIALVCLLGLLSLALLAGSYQLYGEISFSGIGKAQSSPLIWLFELGIVGTFYWGYRFINALAATTERVIDEKDREFESRSGDLESKLKYRSDHDQLTQLPNYHFMMHLIGQSIPKLGKQDFLAVVVIKLNDFKEINYQFGSFGANNILLQFAETLKSILLEPCMLQPYMGMNMIGRLQGAEFAILLPRLRHEHHFETIIQTILDKAKLDFSMDDKHVKVTTTIGAALYPTHGDTAELLLHRASVGLQCAEKEGLPWVMYDERMENQLKSSE